MHKALLAAVIVFAFAAPALASDLTLAANERYLAENAKKPGVVVLPNGLQYRVLKSGSGRTPTVNDIVTVSYKGARIDGYVFDETKPGETRNLPVGRLIAGWTAALSLMKEGDEWELVVPAALGYGDVRAAAGAIPPNQTLVFDMQLIAVVHPQ